MPIFLKNTRMKPVWTIAYQHQKSEGQRREREQGDQSSKVRRWLMAEKDEENRSFWSILEESIDSGRSHPMAMSHNTSVLPNHKRHQQQNAQKHASRRGGGEALANR